MTASLRLFDDTASWSAPAAGIAVTLVLMEGDADSFTTQTERFPDTAEGQAQAQQLFEALQALAPAIARKPEASLEDYCAVVAKKTGLPQDALFEMLDEFVRSDSCDVHALQPVALVVERTREDGTVERKRFEHRQAYTNEPVSHGYLLLHPISSQWLRAWD